MENIKALCIKDVVMENGEHEGKIAFTMGEVYKTNAEEHSNIWVDAIDNFGENHGVGKFYGDDFFKDHFVALQSHAEILPKSKWEDIFRNLKDMDEDDYYDDSVDWVEVIWLEGASDRKDEWVLGYGEEVFEDGFNTEREAQIRLTYLENILL